MSRFADNEEYAPKPFHPLEALALADMSEDARIATLAFRARRGDFGHLSREYRREMTQKKAKEILKHTGEPRGAISRLVDALIREHQHQKYVAGKRQTAARELAQRLRKPSAPDLDSWLDDRFTPTHEHWTKAQRMTIHNVRRVVHNAFVELPRDKAICYLAAQLRAGNLKIYQNSSRKVLRYFLGEELEQEIWNEAENQTEISRGRREARKGLEDLNKPSHEIHNKRSRQMAAFRKRVRRGVDDQPSVNKLQGDRDYERWYGSVSMERGEKVFRILPDRTCVFLAQPGCVMVDNQYSGGQSYLETHNIMFLVYATENGNYGRLRISVKRRENYNRYSHGSPFESVDIDRALESLKRSTVKTKEKKGYRVTPNFDTWCWEVQSPRRRKPVMTPFKLAQRGETPYPSYGYHEGHEYHGED